MARSEPPFLVVGQVRKVHGTRGELFVWPLTDHPESTFAPGVILYLADERGESPDPTEASLSLEEARPFRKGFLVRFPGYADRTAASALRGRYLLRPRSELEALEEGEVFHFQLLGMRVVTVTGEEVGEVVGVFELQPADLLEVRGPRGTHYLPFLESLVRSMDVEGGVLVVDLPEGLLDLS